MKRTDVGCRLAALTGLSGWLFQGGCSSLWIREIEALFAPASPDNALFVLDSILFNLLAPVLY